MVASRPSERRSTRVRRVGQSGQSSDLKSEETSSASNSSANEEFLLMCRGRCTKDPILNVIDEEFVTPLQKLEILRDFPEEINSIVVVKIPNPTDISLVWVRAAVAKWYRYRIVACLVTSSSPVPLKTHRVGQRCTLNLSRGAETASRWCGVVW
ncbi:histone-lysine N-methyltransferase SETMAR [Trichonephila clavipes]|nr:histone-lysine N-methyltransferase SETMAR [Trichonephila clavipes]